MSDIMQRLNASFDELENAICKARENPKIQFRQDIYNRMGAYYEMIEKQRAYAAELNQSITQAKWEDVSRIVNTINAISGFIRDDARALLEEMKNNPKKDEITH